MRYETFNSNTHDTFKVAELTYEVDFRTFDMLYKSKESAVKAIAKDLPKRGLGDYLKVILDDDGEIIGMLMVYTSKTRHRFYLRPLRLIIVDILDHFVLSDIEDDDLYLAELAIDPKLRGFRNHGAKRLYERIGFKVFNKKRVKFLNFERGMFNMEYKLDF